MDCPLLDRLRSFCLPGGEAAARGIRAIHVTQRGEMWSAPGGKAIAFTADETIEATRSAFCWEARYAGGRLTSIHVTDAYENGRGRLVVKVGGLVTVKKMTGPEVDAGELQRYLGSVGGCPPMLVQHPTLDWSIAGPATLRLADRADPAGTSVEIDVRDDGRPLRCRAPRHRAVGSATVLTPWSGVNAGFEEWEGLRISRRTEAVWHLPDGDFTYFRNEILTRKALR